MEFSVKLPQQWSPAQLLAIEALAHGNAIAVVHPDFDLTMLGPVVGSMFRIDVRISHHAPRDTLLIIAKEVDEGLNGGAA